MAKPARALNTLDAIALTVGSMVGAGIFTILALTVQTAGPSAVLSWILIVVLSLPMARTFSGLTTVLSQSGGPYIYVRERISPAIGLWIAWLFLLSSIGASAALLIALIGMLQQLGTAEPLVMGGAVLFMLTVVTSLGIHIGAMVQRVLTVATVLLLTLAIVIGLAHASWLPDAHIVLQPAGNGGVGSSFIHAVFPHGIWAILPAAFYAFWTYSGWEAVSVPSGAYASRHALARGMMFGSLLVGVLYICVAISAVLSIPSHELATHINPLVLVGELWGPLAGRIIGWGALVVVTGSLLSWLISSAGLLQALMRDRLLPAPTALERFQGEYHPSIPWLVALLLGVLAVLPVFSLLIAASSLTALISYAIVFLTVLLDRVTVWEGVLKHSGRRRITSAAALVMTLCLIGFSGWANLWPTMVLCLVGGLLIWARRSYWR